MNIKFSKIAFASLALGASLGISSCVNEDPWGSNDRTDGKILLNLKTDGSIIEKTRAEEQSPYVPKESDFSISLKSNDGSYSNSWTSLEAFNKEKGFPMGSYIITASYGEKSQEGFENPYFSGSANVNVSLGSTTDVEITATLANSMVSIEWDDAISSYFPNHSAIAQTEGKDPVVYVQNENRPGYVTSGNVTLKVTLTDESKNTITISPTSFIAEPRKHYKVKFGIEGGEERGYGHLTVDWSEETVNETKEIFLSEEMFDAPAPSVSLVGANQEVSVIEGLDYEDVNPEFHLFAYGSLAKATLYINADSDVQLPPCGAIVELVGDKPTDESIVKSSGIDCSGIYDRQGDMAVVNIKELVKSLVPGVYTFTFEIEDELGRVTDNSVTFKVSVTKLDYKIIYVNQPEFLDKELTIVLGTNNEDVKNQFSFKSLTSSDDLEPVEAELLSNFDFSVVTSDYQHKYAYKLTVPEIDDYKWKVSASISGKGEDVKEIDVNMPSFTLEFDAFAKRAKIRLLQGTDENIKNLIFERGKIYDGENEIFSDLNKISQDAILSFTNLDPNKTYNYTLNLGRNIYPGYVNNAQFTTEEDLDVPNGNFEASHETIHMENVDLGGKYRVTVMLVGTNYQNWSNIIINEADGWDSINNLTCSEAAQNKNTWFVVPSTFVNKGICTIRSVGYSLNGTTPPTSGGNGNMNTKYYGENSPSLAELEKAVGELSYSSEKQNTTFKSRPSKLTFDYSYMCYKDGGLNEENGLVEIKILDSSKKEISSITKNLECTSNWGFDNNNLPYLNDPSNQIEIDLPEYEFGTKASYVSIVFKSKYDEGTPNIYIPTGTALSEGIGTGAYLNENNRHIATNSYHAFAMGSELKVSNVHFVY